MDSFAGISDPPSPTLQDINRHFQGGFAVAVFGELAAAHVDLEGRDDQLGCCQLGIALGPELDKFFPGFAATDMDIFMPLLADCCLPGDGAAAGSVIMAGEEPGLIRQGKHPLDRIVQLPGITAREVGTGRAAIGHEERIPRKRRVTDDMHHAGRGMPRRCDGEGRHPADAVGITIFKESIEL